MLTLIAWFATLVEELPEEVVDLLPPDVVKKLTDGIIDTIPADIFDRLPEGLQDKVPSGLVEAAANSPVFAAIGVVAIMGFVFGVAKSAVKAMLFFGVVAAIAWYFFLE